MYSVLQKPKFCISVSFLIDFLFCSVYLIPYLLDLRIMYTYGNSMDIILKAINRTFVHMEKIKLLESFANQLESQKRFEVKFHVFNLILEYS